VADGSSGEVLQLGGYMCIRPEPKAEEKRGCGAHRGGKRRRRDGVQRRRRCRWTVGVPMGLNCCKGGGVREQYGCRDLKREALRGDIHREGEEGDSAQRLPAGEASDGVGARMRWTAMAPHGGELRRRSWVVAQGGSGHGRRQFVPKGNKKENPAWAASMKKWRGSGAGDATRRKEEGNGAWWSLVPARVRGRWGRTAIGVCRVSRGAILI
jgi:hypothetical protein